MGRRPVAVVAAIAFLGLPTACAESTGDEESGPATTSAAPTTAPSTTVPSTTASTGETSAGVSSPVPSPTETVRRFDVEVMNADVRRVVTEDYDVSGVRDVSCPRNEPVEVGASFVCHVELADGERTVTITVETEKGRYRVGVPE
ncbi:hypothetical protein GCM10009676_07410 [Prauserella halophila]|uniref:DUF4333 domain-containing protein n=1 Tax=Prauserella halophila TaxID=185641 RepID=A0ABN1VYG6_9PSEU|nr:DUF4333 domain-containing protein [Prauserella halophila]MCP2237207.1 protein of unknown function (DUF4333) [Prauserella halophila]